MPRWNNNPADAVAGFPLFEKGTYEITVKKVSAWISNKGNNKDGELPYGVRVQCTTADNKPYGALLMQHNEVVQGFAKRFIMSAYGFPVTPEGEEAFNQFAATKEWDIEKEGAHESLGSGYTDLVGRALYLDADVKTDENNRQQQVASYRPL